MCPNNTGDSRSALPPAPAPPAAAAAVVAPPVPYAVPQPEPMPFSPTVPVVINKPNKWSTGLYSCCEDCSSCMATCCCPCITFGQNAEIIDRGTTSCIGAGIVYYMLCHACCSCIYTCTYRKKLRSLYGLKEEPCSDFFVHCFCHFCAICQEYRELQNHGFDPSVGWLANVDRINRGGGMAPPAITTTMAR